MMNAKLDIAPKAQLVVNGVTKNHLLNNQDPRQPIFLQLAQIDYRGKKRKWKKL
jgi:hypothetical protein